MNWVEFYRKENGGAASARNKGISLSDGDIVLFLDSDDLWEKTKIEKQIKYMIKHDLKWCATAYRSFGSGKDLYVVPYESTDLCWQHIYNSCRIQTSTVAVYRNLLQDDEPFPTDMRNGQDIFLWFKLANSHVLGVIDEPLTKFRLRGTNAHLNYFTHVRVRALLWEKMNKNMIFMPKSALTKFAYKLCWNTYKSKYYENNRKVLIKFRFVFAWLLFRIGNCYIK